MNSVAMQRPDSNRALGAVVLLLSLLVAVAGVWKLRAGDAAVPALRLAPEPGCDLYAGPCRTQLPGGGTLSLTMDPSGVPLMRPFAVRVALEGVSARAAAVEFNGVDMNMGETRFPLVGDGAGRFTGEALLPVCVRGSMLWEATVRAVTERGVIEAPFRFVSGREVGRHDPA